MKRDEYWKYPFGIKEEDYGKYELKFPYTIKQLIEMAELFEESSRYFGIWGWEDLYGIRGESEDIEYWFTVRRNTPYERINWLSREKCGEFIMMSIIDELEKESK